MHSRILRNPEWKRFLLGALAGSMTAAAAALGLWGPVCGGFVLLICAVLIAGFWRFTEKRYDRLEELSCLIDEVLHGSDHLRLVPDEEGELAVLADRLYKMTVRLREQAEQLQEDKHYLKDSLADISHQVKTPLTGARLTLQRLRSADISEEERRALLREVDLLLTRVEGLMELLLKMARLESGTVELQTEPVKVKEILEKALAPLEIPLELKDISVEIEAAEQVSYMGDFLWSLEALENLLKNCMEHTPKGGCIRIEAAENPVYTEIHIQDTGSGFAEEDLPHLFERFYRGKNETVSGNGIGLSLSSMIVRRQNGVLRADNHPKGGAEFYIRIYKGTV